MILWTDGWHLRVLAYASCIMKLHARHANSPVHCTYVMYVTQFWLHINISCTRMRSPFEMKNKKNVHRIASDKHKMDATVFCVWCRLAVASLHIRTDYFSSPCEILYRVINYLVFFCSKWMPTIYFPAFSFGNEVFIRSDPHIEIKWWYHLPNAIKLIEIVPNRKLSVCSSRMHIMVLWNSYSRRHRCLHSHYIHLEREEKNHQQRKIR